MKHGYLTQVYLTSQLHNEKSISYTCTPTTCCRLLLLFVVLGIQCP